MRHVLGGRLAAVVAGTLTAVLLMSGSGNASPPTVNRGVAAAGWLARQMVDGQHFEAEFGGEIFPDQGLTIDAIFAFAATHAADDFAARATGWLAEPDILTGYIGDGTDEAFAGATAKLALAVEVRQSDPTAFGGVNLVAVLRGLRQPSGRFSDRSAFGDFSNAFSQSLAILALVRTPAGVPDSAVRFLAGTRCADGGYPLLFGQATCTGDVDATAMDVQALRAAGRMRAAVSGERWLMSVQAPDGGFASGGVENANSTGLAAQALREAGHRRAAARARVFLRGLQVGCAGAPANRGAIAFTSGGLDPSTVARATAQAVLGLARTGFAGLDAAGSRPGAPVLRCPPSS